MAAIKVKLRIVGLYFNKTVKILDSPTLTVRNVMDEYIRLNPNLAVPGGLEYTRYPQINPDGSIGDVDFVRAISYHHDGVFDFDGNNIKNLQPAGPDGTSLGDNPRRAGIYTLSEDLGDQFTSPGVGLVWQYYVVGADGVVKSKTPSSRGFKSFGAIPDYNIEDKDTIIWRLVAIARKPNFLDAI